MDYTLSPQLVVHPGTGQAMHEENQATTTVWSDKDANSLIWSLMEVVKAGGQAGVQFDEDVPATYKVLTKALRAGFGGNVTTLNLANSPLVLTPDHAGLILVDATAGNVSATLPAANALLLLPLQFRFLKVDASVNVGTINRAGADIFVGGAASFSLTGQGDFRSILSDMASKWGTLSIAPPAGVKPGMIFLHGGTSAPTGSLLCPTSATNVSRVTYAALFAAIGTTWGAGDGATTFGIPWFPADYAPVQANANVGTATTGQVIAHDHSLNSLVVFGGASAILMAGTGSQGGTTSSATGSTGGAANLAAGKRVLICVQY